MNVLILAAGFGERFRQSIRQRLATGSPQPELTAMLKLPKGLQKIQGRPILGWTLDLVQEIPGVDFAQNLFFVTNALYHSAFHGFLQSVGITSRHILCDGAKDNQHRLGAIRDLELAIRHFGLQDDLLVVSSDNLFQFSLADFVAGFHKVDGHYATGYAASEGKGGIATVDESRRITLFREYPDRKPLEKGQLVIPTLYCFKQRVLSALGQYLEQSGVNTDAPGHFLIWLVQQQPVFVHDVPGLRFDIGNIDGLEEAERYFQPPESR